MVCVRVCAYMATEASLNSWHATKESGDRELLGSEQVSCTRQMFVGGVAARRQEE